MSTPTDLAYEYAATVDGEWGCCHGEHDLRAGGRAPSFNGDEFEPLPADCLGAGVVAKWLPLLAQRDAALIAKAKAEGAVEALREAARVMPMRGVIFGPLDAVRWLLGRAAEIEGDPSQESIVCADPANCPREHVGGMGGTPVHLPPDGVVVPGHFDHGVPSDAGIEAGQ